jgi:peroxiredoxin
MKKNIYLLLASLFIFSCSSGPHYIVKAKIDGSDSVIFYLQKNDAGKIIAIDSAKSIKGSFIMKNGSVNYPQMVQLVAGKTRKRVAFYLENSEISITGNLDSLFNAKISGSKTQDEYNAFIELNKPLSDKYSKTYLDYQVARKTNNKDLIALLENRSDSIEKEMALLEKNYIRNHPKSYITPSLLTNLSYDLNPEELESMINGLDTSLVALPQIKELSAHLNVMKIVSVGQKAPDFTLNDPEGKPVSLASKTGPKLLLIDFWASWCGPCRNENPNVVKVYGEFHKKGFDIIGVSLDHSKDAWVKAISDDKLTWTHVSDLKHWDSDVAKLYAVNAIPSNFLLDEKGIIIGRNLRGQALYNKVKSVLSK